MYVRCVDAILRCCAIAFALSLAWPATALETCDQCKYLVCLKGKLQNLQDWKREYGRLRGKYAPGTDSKLFYDYREMKTPAERAAARAKVDAQYDEYVRDRVQIGKDFPLTGCGPIPDEAETNPVTCKTDGVARARENATCSQMADRIREHEALHSSKCFKRKETKYRDGQLEGPAILITMAGLAAEEMEAHQADFDALKPIVDDLERRCKLRFKEPITLRCTSYKGPDGLIESVIQVGYWCGSADATWFKSQNKITYTQKLKGIPPVETESVNPAGEGDCKPFTPIPPNTTVGDVGSTVCMYSWSDQELPRLSLRNNPIRMCIGDKPADYFAKAEWTEECPAEYFKKK